MKKHIFYISIFILFVYNYSCTRDWLNPSPLSIYTPENVYNDKSGFDALLVKIRHNLKNEHYKMFSWMTAEYAASDIAIGGYGPDFSFLTPNGTPERYPVDKMFPELYRLLKDVNTLISRIGLMEWEDDTAKNEILAEGFWHKAYLYYRLIHSYGDVPYVDTEYKEAILDFETYSRWAILDKIQSELEWAVEYLPEISDSGVPNKFAGLHLLTKIYLSNLDFDKAIESATKVIEGPYELMVERFGIDSGNKSKNVIWDLHRHENISDPINKETIIAIIDRPDAPKEARDFQFHAANYIPHFWNVPDESGSRGIVYPSTMLDSLLRGQGITVTSRYYRFGIWKEQGYDWSSTPDLRRADLNWIEPWEITYNVETSPNFGEPIKKRWPNDRDTCTTWYSWPHYLTANSSGIIENNYSGGNGDTYIFRLAETYLLRAEAFYWNGEIQKAADDLNVVRNRSNAPLIEEGRLTIDVILDERAKELYTEEPRHSELVRISNILAKLNINGYNLESIGESNFFHDRIMRVNDLYDREPGTWRTAGQTVRISPHNIYWPIPQNVITSNTMGVINQNFGYDGFENNIEPIDHIE